MTINPKQSKSVPMFKRTITVHVEFPALDRLLNYLDAADQQEIDTVSDQLKALAKRLQKSRLSLQGEIQKENQ